MAETGLAGRLASVPDLGRVYHTVAGEIIGIVWTCRGTARNLSLAGDRAGHFPVRGGVLDRFHQSAKTLVGDPDRTDGENAWTRWHRVVGLAGADSRSSAPVDPDQRYRLVDSLQRHPVAGLCNQHEED